MPTTLPLLREEITYEEARQRETNTLHQLTYPKAQLEFYNFVYRRQTLIQKRVAHHLGLPSPSVCHVAAPKDWMQGSFNLCVPVTVGPSKRVLIRFPLPYRIGDKICPGNGDEKVRCEAGTYAWMQQECPGVPIPHLYGFALSTGQCFTAVQHRPLLVRFACFIRARFLSWLGRTAPSTLIPHRNSLSNELGAYLLIEHIDETQGQMLSKSWETGRMDDGRRRNLFRSLSQVMLSMARVHLPRIGSFLIDNQGYIRLENRPLTLDVQDLENNCIPLGIPRDRIYSTVDAYVDSLLSYHDNRLRYQPNAVNDAGDCATQMCALVLMRALRQQFFDTKLNHAFAICLTDLNINNILVDNDWNITHIIDLEWSAVLPLEFIRTPHWLTNQAVDEINVDEYSQLREEFMAIFEGEERNLAMDKGNFRCSSILNATWALGTFWYVLALQSLTGLHPLLYERIMPHFDKTRGREFWKSHDLWKSHSFWKSAEFWNDTEFYLDVYPYWTKDAKGFIRQKVEDKKTYDEELREVFDPPP